MKIGSLPAEFGITAQRANLGMLRSTKTASRISQQILNRFLRLTLENNRRENHV